MHSAGGIEIGSIGWEDEDEYAFIEDDGYTFVRVQLFRGKDPTKPINKKRAQGLKLIAHIDGGFQRIPPRDTRCYVAIPAGADIGGAIAPGSALIIGTVEKNTDGRLEKDRTILDFGDQHVIIKGKSVTISDNNDNFLGIGEPRAGGDPALLCQMANGTGFAMKDDQFSCWVASGTPSEAKTMFRMTTAKIEMMQKVSPIASSMISISGDINITSPNNCWLMTAGVMIGVPDLTTPALPPYMPLVAGPLTFASNGVFIAKKGP